MSSSAENDVKHSESQKQFENSNSMLCIFRLWFFCNEILVWTQYKYILNSSTFNQNMSKYLTRGKKKHTNDLNLFFPQSEDRFFLFFQLSFFSGLWIKGSFMESVKCLFETSLWKAGVMYFRVYHFLTFWLNRINPEVAVPHWNICQQFSVQPEALAGKPAPITWIQIDWNGFALWQTLFQIGHIEFKS